MKKYLVCVIFVILCTILLISTNVEASTGATVFIGEPIILDNYDNVGITYNKVDINEETSEISNVQIFTNLSNEKIVRKASIKLEDSYSSLTINSLKIVVNGVEINNITKENDDYVFYFEILPNESKQIEVSYKTDSDLQNAKIIKYSMDKLKGKKIDYFYISIKLSEYDIPLVEKIWPGAYEFDNNTVSTEYIDFTVNNLTSSIVMQKETYKGLKYGDYAETYNEVDEYIIEHAKELIDNGFEIKYNTNNIISEEEILKSLTGTSEEYPHLINSVASAIFHYVEVQTLEKNNQLDLLGESFNYIKLEHCLAEQEIGRILEVDHKEYNKKVAINYYETEQGKELYVHKNITGNWEDGESKDVKKDEYTILRTNTGNGKSRIYPERIFKAVFVNSDIDGNKIDISESEILDFINMMNIDLYVRRIIYDPRTEDEYIYGGYYTEETKEIGKQYTVGGSIKSINESLERIKETYQSGRRDLEWYNKVKKEDEERIQKLESNNSYIKFDNEDVETKIKTPIVAQCIAKCVGNKISFIETIYGDGFGDIYDAVECDIAKQMLEENTKRNNEKKNEIAGKIQSVKITQDEKEYEVKPEEIRTNDNNNVTEPNTNKVSSIEIYYKYIIIVSMIVILLVVLVTVLIKGRKK